MSRKHFRPSSHPFPGPLQGACGEKRTWPAAVKNPWLVVEAVPGADGSTSSEVFSPSCRFRVRAAGRDLSEQLFLLSLPSQLIDKLGRPEHVLEHALLHACRNCPWWS